VTCLIKTGGLAVCCRCVTVCCSELQCVAVCCSVLQRDMSHSDRWSYGVL